VPSTYVFAVAADTEEFTIAVDAFNRTLVFSLGALGLGLLLAVIAQVYYGLLPLQRIRGALAAVREGRAERFEGKFPNEVEPLVAELNGLLDHTTEVLARARAHVGNLAHGLKTPLTVLANEGDSPTAETAAIIRQQTSVMRRQVDHYLSRTRAIGDVALPRAHTDLMPVIQGLARTLEKIHAGSTLSLVVDCDAGLTFRGEQHDLEEMLGNLADNACKWANTTVHITARALAATGSGGLRVAITVDDDGPGVDPELRPFVFDRGRRLDESKPGSGLGLSIVRDIAALYGGHCELTDSPLGGLRAVLILPGGMAESP
jgi:signal transduction histidine kinase